MLIGYARISTDDQNLGLQLDALTRAGCERIYKDQGISGAVADRRALNDALAVLTPGDVLITWKLDRLGRSLAHLIAITTRLEAEGIGFRSLSEAIDTTTASGRLLFHVMGAIAEFERSLISERTRAGMAAAKARGQHLGRDHKITDADLEWARRTLELGHMCPLEVARMLSVAPITLSRSLRRGSPTDEPTSKAPQGIWRPG
jgi:DNA invertase Pin-like site-specific DNA recombinase